MPPSAHREHPRASRRRPRAARRHGRLRRDRRDPSHHDEAGSSASTRCRRLPRARRGQPAPPWRSAVSAWPMSQHTARPGQRAWLPSAAARRRCPSVIRDAVGGPGEPRLACSASPAATRRAARGSADLKSIVAQGGYGMAAITALTAQNTHGVRRPCAAGGVPRRPAGGAVRRHRHRRGQDRHARRRRGHPHGRRLAMTHPPTTVVLDPGWWPAAATAGRCASRTAARARPLRRRHHPQPG